PNALTSVWLCDWLGIYFSLWVDDIFKGVYFSYLESTMRGYISLVVVHEARCVCSAVACL
ncbi:hypothetical protein A2U01_0076697, partial [Trifolium medium]|nr:hypothetical protein [Trifolium medium]